MGGGSRPLLDNVQKKDAFFDVFPKGQKDKGTKGLRYKGQRTKGQWDRDRGTMGKETNEQKDKGTKSMMYSV